MATATSAQRLVRKSSNVGRQAPFRKHTATAGRARSSLVVRAGAIVEPGATVLVAGGTGGVGQLVTAKLLERGYNVRLLARNPDKARQLFGEPPNMQVVVGDTRTPAGLADACKGVHAVCSCTGTTAFPSSRWEGNNGPRPTDYEGAVNLIDAVPRSIKRYVLVSSVGVERQKEFPYSILNLFGVLRYKRLSELHLLESGLPYTIIRPNRLTDGPYTSFDLNTLLKATSGTRQQVEIAAGDCLGRGEASRIAVAEAVVQALSNPVTNNQLYCLGTTEGEGPGTDAEQWNQLFAACSGAASRVQSAVPK